ncbi:DUF3784 domain-containing protein [Niallia taxi]|uniref:DUF3784 domain-containing protein n=1 Tax=Niallia taxi TaxID=2499688 RepID=UPI0015F5CE64|nr:DUF3784 domain-containing protein [Niallia taxi]
MINIVAGIIVLVMAVLFSKKKALFLIAGFDKDEWDVNQTNSLAKAMAGFMLNLSILIITLELIEQFVSNGNTIRFIEKVIAAEFFISLILITYKGFTLKKIH